jgi:hypothetical protein
MLFSWFTEVAEYSIEQFSFKKTLSIKMLIAVIVILAISVLFLLVTSSANILIEQQNM